ncbi:MAG: hypothetical protein S4CHLAM37_07500 [Chlamydiia bacterium]|nr:hypothetical protein [Chlamydiia bacterium]
MATLLSNPVSRNFSFHLDYTKKPDKASSAQGAAESLGRMQLQAFYTEESGSQICTFAQGPSSRPQGILKFKISGRVLLIEHLASPHGYHVIHKLMIVAYAFFKFHSCSSIEINAKPTEVIPLLKQGFLPQDDTICVSINSGRIRTFNARYPDGHGFTREAFEALDRSYIGFLAKLARCHQSDISFEYFLEKWPWKDPIYTEQHSVKSLARAIFNAKDPAEEETPRAYLGTQESIPMTLPAHALKIYGSEATIYPRSSFTLEVELRSVWLPNFPKTRHVNISGDITMPILCEVQGSSRKSSYTVQKDSSILGRIYFSVGYNAIRISKIEVVELDPTKRQAVLRALLDTASEAAFTNSHCRGRVEFQLPEASPLVPVLKDFGYIEDLTGMLKRLSLSHEEGAEEVDVNDVLLRFDIATASRWRTKFYANRLQEELLHIILGNHPYMPSESPENLIRMHNTLSNLLMNLDLFMTTPAEEKSFEERVSEYYYQHAAALVKGDKKTKRSWSLGRKRHVAPKAPTEEDAIASVDAILYSEHPLILYMAVFKVLCDDSKSLMPSSILKKKPDFIGLFDKINTRSFSDLTSRISITPPLPEVKAPARRGSLPVGMKLEAATRLTPRPPTSARASQPMLRRARRFSEGSSGGSTRTASTKEVPVDFANT